MSLKNVENFYLLLSKDKNISKELENKIDEYKEHGVFSKAFIKEVIIPIAQNHGLIFSFSEFADYIKNRYIGLTKEQLKILDDSELEVVVGGISEKISYCFFDLSKLV